MSIQKNSFLTGDSGSTAVEFGLVLPGLAMLIVGTLLVLRVGLGLRCAAATAAVDRVASRPFLNGRVQTCDGIHHQPGITITV
jgi:Flp pilus assembly pilin Flp